MSARYWFAVATALVLGASASAAPIGGGVAPACDRVCMTGIVDRYLADDAMAYIGTLSCSDQFDTHVMDFITRLWPRRHEIVDEGIGMRGPRRTQETIDPATVHVPTSTFDRDDQSEAGQIGVGRQLRSRTDPSSAATKLEAARRYPLTPHFPFAKYS
jgi:hypothetical protein